MANMRPKERLGTAAVLLNLPEGHPQRLRYRIVAKRMLMHMAAATATST